MTLAEKLRAQVLSLVKSRSGLQCSIPTTAYHHATKLIPLGISVKWRCLCWAVTRSHGNTASDEFKTPPVCRGVGMENIFPGADPRHQHCRYALSVCGTPRLHFGVLTWASSALHTSCSLSGVMSTGTSKGEPSSWPPSSWNCTSSRCTSPAAALSCRSKPGGCQSPSVFLWPGDPTRRPGVPAPRAYTYRHRRRHPASPRGGEPRRKDRASRPCRSGQPPATAPSRVRGSQVTPETGITNGVTRWPPSTPSTLSLAGWVLSHFSQQRFWSIGLRQKLYLWVGL